MSRISVHSSLSMDGKLCVAGNHTGKLVPLRQGFRQQLSNVLLVLDKKNQSQQQRGRFERTFVL